MQAYYPLPVNDGDGVSSPLTFVRRPQGRLIANTISSVAVRVHLSFQYPKPEDAYPERRIVLNREKPSVVIGRASQRQLRIPAIENCLLESPVISRDHAEIFVNFEAKVSRTPTAFVSPLSFHPPRKPWVGSRLTLVIRPYAFETKTRATEPS